MSEDDHTMEQQMRDAAVPWPKTAEELSEYIECLIGLEHDYGTAIYAVSMAATVTFHYVVHRLGASGTQAPYAELDILRRMRDYRYGFANGAVTLHAPFAAMTKLEVAKLAQRLGVNIGLTYSCQLHPSVPCGACPNCTERLQALAALSDQAGE